MWAPPASPMITRGTPVSSRRWGPPVTILEGRNGTLSSTALGLARHHPAKNRITPNPRTRWYLYATRME